jgi:hypothetical protein
MSCLSAHWTACPNFSSNLHFSQTSIRISKRGLETIQREEIGCSPIYVWKVHEAFKKYGYRYAQYQRPAHHGHSRLVTADRAGSLESLVLSENQNLSADTLSQIIAKYAKLERLYIFNTTQIPLFRKVELIRETKITEFCDTE